MALDRNVPLFLNVMSEAIISVERKKGIFGSKVMALAYNGVHWNPSSDPMILYSPVLTDPSRSSPADPADHTDLTDPTDRPH